MDEPIESTESIAAIEKDVVQLQECIEILHDTVQTQQHSFDTIEDVIHQSQRQIQWSHSDIINAENNMWYYRSLVTPILSGIAIMVAGVVTGIF